MGMGLCKKGMAAEWALMVARGRVARLKDALTGKSFQIGDVIIIIRRHRMYTVKRMLGILSEQESVLRNIVVGRRMKIHHPGRSMALSSLTWDKGIAREVE